MVSDLCRPLFLNLWNPINRLSKDNSKPISFCFALNPSNALKIEGRTPDFQPVLSYRCSWSFLHYSTMLIFVDSYRTRTITGITTVICVVPDRKSVEKKTARPSLLFFKTELCTLTFLKSVLILMPLPMVAFHCQNGLMTCQRAMNSTVLVLQTLLKIPRFGVAVVILKG